MPIVDYSSEEEGSSHSGSPSRSHSESPSVSPSHSVSQKHSASPNSRASRSNSGSRSVSPASNASATRSRASVKSSRNGSASPHRSDGSAVPSHQSRKSSSRSGSRSPSSRSSGSASPARSDVSVTHSQSSGRSSRSPTKLKNGSASPARSDLSEIQSKASEDPRSRTRSRSQSKSRNGSVSPARSDGSAASSQRSGSGSRSPSKSRSRSGSSSSAKSDVSAVRSEKSGKSSRRSGSGSPRSGSASPARSDVSAVASQASRKSSRSSSPSGSDKSGSVASGRSKSNSPTRSEHSDDDRKSNRSDRSGSVKSAKAEDLFGDANDLSSDDDMTGVRKRATRDSFNEDSDEHGNEGRLVIADDDSDDENKENDSPKETMMEEEEEIPEGRIDVEIPKISLDLGRDIHFVKMPNFLSVDTRPFEPNTYEDEIDEEDTLDEEGRARLKLKAENTIRWRYGFDKEGNVIKESNARMVRWSDGSMSLHLGSEIFDVYKQPFAGDHNHLFVRQGTGLQGQAVFRSKLSFRPHSTESFTHRKMTLSLADRSQKTSGIKVLTEVGANPDHDRTERIKKEEEKLRASLKREVRQKRTKGKGPNQSVNSSFLEASQEDGSDEENAISLSAIKNRYKKNGADRPNIYSSEDSASDSDEIHSKKPVRNVGIDDDSESNDSPAEEKSPKSSD